ncbi:hypothetical protein [Paenimyroides viscosum]|uniref:Uncharacterized protein n=1 Tax=Paenimyroides viscosum TaxID=2488729 RepID=A0A3P1B3L9_9FLAO|nr:hypothetical protein [Paenimyroides viscosum]RRA95584.1 hypothetical protein EG242_05545 [Paenimyroides viscosum]
MKTFLIFLIMTTITINAHSQSTSNSETTKTYSKISEKKEEITKNKTLYKKSTISVEYDGGDNNTYEYSMNSPSGNELEISINDNSNEITFFIFENDDNSKSNADIKSFREWKGVYKNDITIKVKTKEKGKKYSFSLIIMEKIEKK